MRKSKERKLKQAKLQNNRNSSTEPVSTGHPRAARGKLTAAETKREEERGHAQTNTEESELLTLKYTHNMQSKYRLLSI